MPPPGIDKIQRLQYALATDQLDWVAGQLLEAGVEQIKVRQYVVEQWGEEAERVLPLLNRLLSREPMTRVCR